MEISGTGTEIPVGVIVMWSGLLAAIPAGWALCDGGGGRPDLRDRFIQGAAAGVDPGATGGATTHTHAGHSAHASLATHQHGTPFGERSAGVNLTFNEAFGQTGVQDFTKNIVSASFTLESINVKRTEAISGGTPDAHSAHDAPDSRPPFFRLAFIIKV